MQLDGYLALHPLGTHYTTDYGYWNYKTPGQGNNVRLNLDDNGHLYLDNGNGTAGIVYLNLGDNPTKGLLYLLRIDANGILRLYSHNMDQNGTWSITWSQPDIGSAQMFRRLRQNLQMRHLFYHLNNI